MPQAWLGETMEPRVSVPSENPTRPAAVAEADPALEPLETRLVPTIFTVTNINDSGAGSLRDAVIQANSNTGPDTIAFSGLFNTPQTITLTSGAITFTDTATTTVTGPGANLLTVSGGNFGSNYINDHRILVVGEIWVDRQ